MAGQYSYPGMQQTGQAGGYPPFHYPTPSGDQNAQLLQGYALPQQNSANAPGGMFGAQSAASYNFDQSSGGYSQSSSVPVCQVGAGSQVPMQPGAGGFAYPDFSAQFNQYGGMGQNVPPGLTAVQAGLGGDMQQFGPLMTNAFGQPMSTNGAILEALAHEQGLAGFNPMAFLQDPTGASRGGTARGSQRGGYNKFGGRTNSNLPSVTNPDGLREDTVFVSNLPQNIDHETMKAQFGVVGKIKINSKSGMPMVWIFKEKGIPKGDALVTYEDPQCVQAAIKWFQEHEFLGRKIEVKQATNSQRPVIIPPGGGGQNSAMMGTTGMMNTGTPANPAAALAAAAVAAAASGNTMASLMNNSAAAAASLAALTGVPGGQFDGKDYSSMGRGGGAAGRGGRGGVTNGTGSRPSGGSNQAGSREGDWSCTQCGNINFSWREQCNRCHAPRAQDMSAVTEMPGMGRGVPTGMPRGGGQGNIPVLNTGPAPVGVPGFGRGGPVGGAMPVPGRGGRGGGPMRGSGVGVGRARPAPY
ncbi:unnamed protein product [Calicophoron daubneyi]|uniref:Uncharacterized protein n=1 Tax=Calicophoron daubneyi TaxID=300641 RepID=A0AAV2TFM9_CALDB